MYDITVNGDGFNHAKLSFKSGMGELYHFELTTDDQCVLLRKLAQDLVFAQEDPIMRKLNIDGLKRLVRLIEWEFEEMENDKRT